MSFTTLKHSVRKLHGGGKVLVLDTGAVITPEAQAMLQALHSRSVGGVVENLEILSEKGADKFMASFYVGYGHKSIGDCGTTTIFIEGVSMLAAKAIQDWQLYSGQESSTRYIDFSSQPFIDPAGTEASKHILEAWRAFYLLGMKPVQDKLKNQYPIKNGEDEKIYEKAINARAFDIMRGFLPAGASTNLAWHTNLRQAADKLMLLRHHPLKEVQDIAQGIDSALQEMFPSSFGHTQHEETETYNEAWMTSENYFSKTNPVDFALTKDFIDHELLAQHRALLATRPAKTELPRFLAECGTVQFEFMLDFGSFRDIQRHRAVTQRMPLVTTAHGFGTWYREEIPKEMHEDIDTLLTNQEKAIAKLNVPKEIAQYYIAMGYNLPNRVTGNLPALVYLVELRATRFVHPTLRRRASEMADALLKQYGKDGLVLHLDDDPGRFDIARGTHDISLK